VIEDSSSVPPAGSVGEDVWHAQEADLVVVDAFHSFYAQLACVNAAVAELYAGSQQNDVTVLLLARTNLAWDLLDVHLAFLVANSRNGGGVRRTPALAIAHTRLRRVLEQRLSYRRDEGKAGELLAQSRRLADRVHRYEREANEPTAQVSLPRGTASKLRRDAVGHSRGPRLGRAPRIGRRRYG
jgi:hypothetical protein